MAMMTPDQSDEWLENHRRKRRDEIARWKRSTFRLVVNKGITPMERPAWYERRL